MKGLRAIILAVALTALAGGGAVAATLNDHAALAGLHVAKALFLVNVRKPLAAERLIRVVGLTERQLRAQKVTPRLLVVFIGPDVTFLTRNMRGIPPAQTGAVAGLQKEIEGLAHRGVRFQACGIAMHHMHVAPRALIAAVRPVQNGFISAIAYQEKGYALVPVS